MPTITVQNVPDSVHKHLKRRAAEHRRRLSQDVLRRLEEAVAESSASDRRVARGACREEQERTPPWSVDARARKRVMREGLA